ncbi:hypothetical protein DKX38_001897 [Salix brachista]|uniref:Plant heme peroxidase family profile domain-containing protein n=1 Tax=Salix brachista TaxID=2182728 RepID=A0A5N5NKQ0_9ROSI|nr:hypothetical protein DKX38_001897 [Salix brachista]
MEAVAVLVFALLVISRMASPVSALSLNYYDQTCPKLESAVTEAVKKATMNDNTVPAALLRMHFHDCFIRSGGPTWDVPKGRKDGRISKASETRQLPPPTFNISQLKQSFSQRGLSLEDLVALSGGHTLGFAHCSSFQNRIHNFNATLDVDPTLNPSFGNSLRSVCPAHNKVKNAGATMDSSATTFDNVYYKLLLQGKSLFTSDQALLSTGKTMNLVSKFASSQEMFEKAFVKSMIKMSSISGGQEIRLDCKVVR